MADFKKDAAAAALGLIKPDSIIGLGAGSTMAHLVSGIKSDASLFQSLKLVTSSFSTRQLLLQEGFTVLDSGWLSRIDLYFDGCDQFDHRLNALKSGGGVHTAEKVLAAMADEFVLVGDVGKRASRFDGKYPLVAEVVPEALAYVTDVLRRSVQPVKCQLRTSDKKDGAVITERGNYLVDSWFEPFPEPAMLNERLAGIVGIVEHSLFYNMASRAVIAGPDGIQILDKI